MKKLIIALALVSLGLALCVNVPGPVTYLTNSEVMKWYPKLKPGTLTVKNQTIYIEDVNKLLGNYTGWLPAIIVKIKQSQVNACKAYGFKVVQGCDGNVYCVEIVNNAPLYIYSGSYTKLLLSLNVTKGIGNPKAKVWVVQLTDPFCPYCALFYNKGGGNELIKLVKEGKIYLIPIVVAFHTNAPAYQESLRLAYQLNKYAEGNMTKAFFELEEKIAKNVYGLYQGKVKLSNVTVSASVLKESNKVKLDLARKLFPMVATPGNVFVNVKTGKAIAAMGALSTKGIDILYQKTLNG